MNISAFARYTEYFLQHRHLHYFHTDSKLISRSCTDMMVHKDRFLVALGHSME